MLSVLRLLSYDSCAYNVLYDANYAYSRFIYSSGQGG